MGNKRISGSRSKCFKKRVNVGKPKSKPSSSSVNTPSTSKTNGPTPTPTSSTRKFKVEGNFDYYENQNEVLGYDIVDLNLLAKAINEIAACKRCKHNLTFERRAVEGLAINITVSCPNCADFDKSIDNCEKITRQIGGKSENMYDLNLRLVHGLRSIGKGYTAAQIVCGALNLPPPPTRYSKHEEVLGNTTESLCKKSMRDAVEEAVVKNEGDRHNLFVALDGSWQKRGHTSLNGILSLTSVDTGKVLDVSIFSKYCDCPQRSNNVHVANCIANYQGSSGAMEVAGALEVFRRSEPEYKVRYQNYLGDGDSKAYASVNEAKVYGEDVEIKKIECVGHVQKRMGSRLLKLKSKSGKTLLKDGKSLSGRGRLTTAAIHQLQTYYGLAIRRNTTSVQAMKNAIWAEYFHVASSNENHYHQLCPKEDGTWCKYNQSLLDETVYDHNQHFHLPNEVMLEIKPIFRDLANPQLLEKCVQGKTQNPNESLNNVIWSVIPKRVFVRLSVLRYGVYLAICTFNNGLISRVQIMEELGLSPGKHLVAAMKNLEKLRLRKAEKAASDLEKKIRKARTLVKRKIEDHFEHQEADNPAYSAGNY